MTHIEALDLQRVPEHLIVLGGGYVGLELAQALRRFGARVTVIERGPQLAIAQLPASAVLRTRTVSELRGFIKMLIAADSDKILGFTAFCVEASELLAAVQTAMAGNLPYTVLRDALYTHPTMSESFVFMLSGLSAQMYREIKMDETISTT